MTTRAAVAWYMILSVLVTAAASTLLPRNVGALIVAWQVGLAIYARWAKRWLVIGNLLVAAISCSAFLAGALVAHYPRAALIPAAIAFVFVVCREIVKGAEDVEGDRRGGVSTLAVVLGAPRAGTIAGVLMLLLAAAMPIPALAVRYRAPYLLGMELLVVPILLSGAMRVTECDRRREFTLTSRLLKLGMFLGIASILFGA
jgi:geranylgeranylglycerol-phosphate geranylgeranyltransferase